MVSFDYRLNPLYPIKECSSCGALYTTDYCCFDGSLGDKIICDLNKTPDLFQEPPQDCPKCGNPIDGHYCQGCALLRKKFKEDLFTYCIENGIFQDFQNTSEPSNDNTNVVNAPQDPFVVKQDLDKNSSQSPPHINHHCCYGYGDSLEDIFYHQCTYESCGKGAYYGYNCQWKVLIIPNLAPCNNQTIDELPQTLSSFDPTCYSRDENSFTYDSKSNIVDDSPNIFSPPLQPPTYAYEFCGNDAYYGHDCPLQVSFTYDPEPCYNQDFNFPHNFQIFNNNIFVVPIMGVLMRLVNDKHCQPEDILELFQRLHNDVQNIYEELAVYINTSSWDRPTICHNDDDNEDCTIGITPILSTKEPNNSLNEVIKYSVENLVRIPSESEGIPDNMCDVPFHDNSPPLDISKDQFEDLSNSNDDSTSIDDDSFSIDDIEYVEASPPNSELVSLESSSGSTTTRADISLPDYEAFYDDHVKEISSGSTTTYSDFSLYDSFIFDLSINPFHPTDRSDFYEFVDELAHIISPPKYDCFSFKNEPNLGDFTMDVVEDIFPTTEPTVYVANVLPTHPTL
nr:hypothetical protein [Tanacetum cinerariifolium]